MLKERCHLEKWCGRRSEGAGRVSTRLDTVLYAEEVMTRVMGSERWHGYHPMDVVPVQNRCAKKTLRRCSLSPLVHMAYQPHYSGEVEVWAWPRRFESMGEAG